MDDTEADTTINDIKIYSEALIVAVNEKRFNDAEEYVNKIQKKLDDIKPYVERKKVAF